MTEDRRDAWRQIRVTFREAVSDGNYGTESAEVTLEHWMATETARGDYVLQADDLLSEARALVHAELERSPSQRVRAGINRRTYSAPDDDDG